MRPDVEAITKRWMFRSETAARDIGILLAYIAELEEALAQFANAAGA